MKKVLRMFFVISLFSVFALFFNKAKASDAMYSFDEKGFVEIGSMAYVYEPDLTNEYISSSPEDFLIKYYTDSKGEPSLYDGDKRFEIRKISTTIGKSGENYKLSDGTTINEATSKGDMACFSYEKVKWVLYNETDEYYELITYKIIDVIQFNYSSASNMDYEWSDLCRDIGDYFTNSITGDERKSLTKYYDGVTYVDIPDAKSLDKNEPDMDKATDYAMLRRLSFAEGDKHLPYWTKTQAEDETRKKARWYDKGTTDCLLTDPEIGVRPVIKIAKSYFSNSPKPVTPDKEDTTPKTSNSSKVDATLVIGITAAIISIGAIATLFAMWSKKVKANKDFRAPKWYIITCLGCTAISLIGIICISIKATGGGAGGSFKTGYYIQAYTQQSSGNTVQVGSTCYLIRSDGTCSYCGYVEDPKAYDFRDETSGTWSKSGSSITINLPSFSFHTTMTIKGGDKLCDPRNGQVAYKWVRGE